MAYYSSKPASFSACKDAIVGIDTIWPALIDSAARGLEPKERGSW